MVELISLLLISLFLFCVLLTGHTIMMVLRVRPLYRFVKMLAAQDYETALRLKPKFKMMLIQWWRPLNVEEWRN
jgi:hypothetical protein